MTKQLTITPYVAGMALAQFPFTEQINNWLRAIPGVRWGGHIKKGAWLIPSELQPQLEKWAKAHSWKTVLPKKVAYRAPDLTDLYPFQKPVVQRILDQRQLLVSLETGLGKTVVGLVALKNLQPARTLIICPALVRYKHWGQHIADWWLDAPPVEVIDTGKKARELEWAAQQIAVTSFELAKYFIDRKYNAVIVDEMHYLQDARTQRSKAIRKLLWRNHDSVQIALTATPITNNPKGLHHQLHSLWANRFGSFWDFVKRYVDITSNEHSDWVFGGLNDDHAKELRARLEAVSVRVTKKEVAHLLPPCIVTPLRVPAPRTLNVRELLEGFARPDQHSAKVKEHMLRATGSAKIKVSVEAALEEIKTDSHVCVCAYYHDTADEIAAMLESKTTTPIINLGRAVASKRMQLIEEARKLKNCIMVATLESVNVGIDLTFNATAICAELFPVPKTMIQFFGRFSRLVKGSLPSKIILVVLEGTQDEAICSVLLARVKDAEKVVKGGAAESGLIEALEIPEEDFLAAVAEMANTRLEEDEYV
jgi:superfamily II DNA or RNA helicase